MFDPDGMVGVETVGGLKSRSTWTWKRRAPCCLRLSREASAWEAIGRMVRLRGRLVEGVVQDGALG